jgi:hypothetical protein
VYHTRRLWILRNLSYLESSPLPVQFWRHSLVDATVFSECDRQLTEVLQDRWLIVITLLNSLFKTATRGAAAATFIVDGNTILTEDAMLLEKFSLRRLTFPTKFNVLEWTARPRLIKNSRQCENCNAPMSLITKTRRIDGYGWRCKTCKSRALEMDHFLVDLIYL